MGLTGAEIAERMSDRGASDAVVSAWMRGRAEELYANDWKANEVAGYFGKRVPDTSHEETYWRDTAGTLLNGETAVSLLDIWEAGLDQSAGGLMFAGAPDKFMPDDPTTAQRVVSHLGGLMGDMPFMIIGGLLASATGPVGATAAAFALPAALRKMLLDHYEDGEIDSSQEFMERLTGTLIETGKGAVLGAATGGAGLVAGRTLGALAKMPAEITTMVTAGAALEGRIPEPHDFIDAAILMGGFRGTGATIKFASKHFVARNLYRRTGVGEELTTDALKDKRIQDDYHSENLNAAKSQQVPRSYKNLDSERPPTAKEVLEAESHFKKQVSIGEKGSKKRWTWDDQITNWVDEAHPIKRLVDIIREGGGPLETLKDPYKVTRLLRGSVGIAKHYLEHGVIDAKTREVVSFSFKDIMRQLPIERLESFRFYGVAKRAIELADRPIKGKGKRSKLVEEHLESGKRAGIDLEKARTLVRSGEAEFGKVFKDLQEYQTGVLKYVKDRGLISEQEFRLMQELNKDYFPFHRLVEKQKANSLFGIGESERVIIDPLESIVKNTYSLIERAETNHAKVVMVEFFEKHGVKAEDHGIRVKSTFREVGFTDKRVDAIIKKLSNGEELTRAQTEQVGKYLSQKHSVVDAPKEGKDRIVVYRNGKREVWQVAEEVAHAFDGVDAVSSHTLVKLLSYPATTLRAGAILTPDFMARNLNRDTLSASVFSGHGFIPFVSTIRGAFSLANKDEHFKGWLKSGGVLSAFTSSDRLYFQKDFRGIVEGANLRYSVQNNVRHPLEMLRVASSFIEEATRVGEFRAATKAARKAGRRATPEEMATAAFSSREVTLDFGRIGAKARAVNMISAFFNAQIQGTSRTIRAFRDSPTATTAKIMGAVTMPSILLHLYNRDKQWYKDMPKWQRDLFWLVEGKVNGKQVIWRIPKPFELGLLFGTVPERIVSSILDEDPHAYDELLWSLARGIFPNPAPNAAIPIYETIQNHSLFLDRPIIPRSKEGLLSKHQYTEHTSELTKTISRVMAMLPGMDRSKWSAPVVIDNFVQAWTGGLGRQGMQLANDALIKLNILPDPIDPTDTLADVFFVKAFVVRYPSSSSADTNRFYRESAELEKPLNSYKSLMKSGQIETALEVLDEYQGDFFDASRVRAVLADVGGLIRNIDNNPGISPDEKRELVDELMFQRHDVAVAGLELVDEYKARRKKEKLETFRAEQERKEAAETRSGLQAPAGTPQATPSTGGLQAPQ